MSTTLANNFYLKALDNYPYCLPEFLESIDYALAYDENHADAHSLMGLFCMEQVYKYSEAKYHFEMALANDIDHILTYYRFIRLAILLEDLELAMKLIQSGRKVKGISKPALLHREAIVMEKRCEFRTAKRLLNKAIKLSVFTHDIDFYKREKSRIKSKMPKKKK